MCPRVTFDQILWAVADQAGVTTASILGPATGPFSPSNWPRQRVVLLTRRIRPDLSWAWIAGQMKRRDHSVPRSACAAGEKRLAECEVEQAIVAQVVASLGLAELPPYRPELGKLTTIEREIRAAEARLATLLGRREELQAQL